MIDLEDWPYVRCLHRHKGPHSRTHTPDMTHIWSMNKNPSHIIKKMQYMLYESGHICQQVDADPTQSVSGGGPRAISFTSL